MKGMKKVGNILATGVALIAVLIYYFLSGGATGEQTVPVSEPSVSTEATSAAASETASTSDEPSAKPPSSKTPPPDLGSDVLTVTFIDIGQGDSELIQLGDSAVLIDSGEYEKRNVVINTLESLGVKKLDLVIATHPHADHMGSMSAIIDHFEIERIMMPNAVATTVAFEKMLQSIQNKGLKIDRPIAGTDVQAGEITLHIFAPNSEKYSDVNNYSIIAKLEHGNVSFLFTGDAEALSEKEVLAKEFDASADVLKLGHHGSSSSTSPDFLAAVGPKLAVISCGAGNTYGHPHRETMAKMNEGGIELYRTDLSGTITMKTDGEEIYVSTEK
ncbi:MAG: MBL fold metallo-hydrolase [Clostridiales bacterium]|jgi:competence protein ComEC|nr:MBL fold metallo-hydrolase [Clostridiales bacterium]